VEWIEAYLALSVLLLAGSVWLGRVLSRPTLPGWVERHVCADAPEGDTRWP